MRLACFTIKVSSPKERMRTHMLTTNYIESFFHIKEEYITGCYQTDEGLVYEVQLPVTTHTCPYCGQDTTRIKDYRVRAVTLGTIHGRPVNAKYNGADISVLIALTRFQRRIRSYNATSK